MRFLSLIILCFTFLHTLGRELSLTNSQELQFSIPQLYVINFRSNYSSKVYKINKKLETFHISEYNIYSVPGLYTFYFMSTPEEASANDGLESIDENDGTDNSEDENDDSGEGESNDSDEDKVDVNEQQEESEIDNEKNLNIEEEEPEEAQSEIAEEHDEENLEDEHINESEGQKTKIRKNFSDIGMNDEELTKERIKELIIYYRKHKAINDKSLETFQERNTIYGHCICCYQPKILDKIGDKNDFGICEQCIMQRSLFTQNSSPPRRSSKSKQLQYTFFQRLLLKEQKNRATKLKDDESEDEEFEEKQAKSDTIIDILFGHNSQKRQDAEDIFIASDYLANNNLLRVPRLMELQFGKTQLGPCLLCACVEDVHTIAHEKKYGICSSCMLDVSDKFEQEGIRVIGTDEDGMPIYENPNNSDKNKSWQSKLSQLVLDPKSNLKDAAIQALLGASNKLGPLDGLLGRLFQNKQKNNSGNQPNAQYLLNANGDLVLASTLEGTDAQFGYVMDENGQLRKATNAEEGRNAGTTAANQLILDRDGNLVPASTFAGTEHSNGYVRDKNGNLVLASSLYEGLEAGKTVGSQMILDKNGNLVPASSLAGTNDANGYVRDANGNLVLASSLNAGLSEGKSIGDKLVYDKHGKLVKASTLVGTSNPNGFVKNPDGTMRPATSMDESNKSAAKEAQSQLVLDAKGNLVPASSLAGTDNPNGFVRNADGSLSPAASLADGIASGKQFGDQLVLNQNGELVKLSSLRNSANPNGYIRNPDGTMSPASSLEAAVAAGKAESGEQLVFDANGNLVPASSLAGTDNPNGFVMNPDGSFSKAESLADAIESVKAQTASAESGNTIGNNELTGSAGQGPNILQQTSAIIRDKIANMRANAAARKERKALKKQAKLEAKIQKLQIEQERASERLEAKQNAEMQKLQERQNAKMQALQDKQAAEKEPLTEEDRERQLAEIAALEEAQTLETEKLQKKHEAASNALQNKQEKKMQKLQEKQEKAEVKAIKKQEKEIKKQGKAEAKAIKKQEKEIKKQQKAEAKATKKQAKAVRKQKKMK